MDNLKKLTIRSVCFNRSPSIPVYAGMSFDICCADKISENLLRPVIIRYLYKVSAIVLLYWICYDIGIYKLSVFVILINRALRQLVIYYPFSDVV